MTTPFELLISHLKDFIVFSSCLVLVTAFYVLQYYFGKSDKGPEDTVEIVQRTTREITPSTEQYDHNVKEDSVEEEHLTPTRRKNQVISEITVKKIYLPRRPSQKRSKSKTRAEETKSQNGVLFEDENANKTIWSD